MKDGSVQKKISVVVATYRRPESLGECIKALASQTRLPDEVMVAMRDDDNETRSFLKGFDAGNINLRAVSTARQGKVAALNIALASAEGGIIAFTDDDAEPRKDWLERIEARFKADPNVGGVGGRDFLYREGELQDGRKVNVGRITWYGRLSGNHHLGFGAPREVEDLKGVNMAFRREAIKAIRFDERLRGTGAQYREDLAFSLAVREAGWRLIYDPAVAVDHRWARRFDEDQRKTFSAIAVENAAYNETLVLVEYLPLWKKVVFLIFSILVGDKFIPGIAQFIRLIPSEGARAFQRFSAALLGRLAGLKAGI